MNIKRIFGSILTILGIVSLLYAAYMFMNTSGGVPDIKALSLCGVLGLIFFIAGISLVRNTKDEA